MPDYDSLQITVTTIVAICAAVIAIWNVYKIKKELDRPAEDRIKRLSEVETKLDNDNKRLKNLEEATRLSLKAQLAIIDHLTSGNHTAQLMEVNQEITDYLLGIRKKG